MRVLHTWIRPLLAAATALVLCAPAQAATAISAEPGAADGVGMDGHCSLREAIDLANGLSPPDCGSSSGAPFTINLVAGTYSLTKTGGDDFNGYGDLDITAGPVTIAGAGAGVTTISYDNHNDRVLQIASGITVAISGVTITGGHSADGADTASTPGGAGENGGGILNAGTLTLTDAAVMGNASGHGGQGGVNGTAGQNGGKGGDGAGIATSGALTVIRSTIASNTAGAGGPPGIGTGSTGFAGSGGQGGGIYCVTCLSLTVQDSTLSGNHTGAGAPGGAGGGVGGDGGAIYLFFAEVTITGTVISGNSAGAGGAGGGSPGGTGGSAGGISITRGKPLVLTDSTISGNSAGNGGNGTRGGDGGEAGGAQIETNPATIRRLTITDNHAGNGAAASATQGGAGGRGGGILLEVGGPGLGDREFTDSTVAGNTAGSGGNAPTAPGAGGPGGGVYSSSLNLTSILNVTIVANSTGAGGSASGAGNGQPGGAGGGIWVVGNPNSPLTLNHVTVAQNKVGASGTGQSGTVTGPNSGGIDFTSKTTLENSILSDNLPANCARIDNTVLTDGGHNVSYADSSCPGINSNPLLAALADNGGPTKTMALSEGSPAIDLVPTSGANCLPADQRGITRPQRSACDAGAFELQPPTPPADQTPTGGGTEQQQTPAPAPAPSDKTPPTVKLLLTGQKLLKALKKGYFAFFSDNELGTSTADLFASGKDAKGAATRKRVAHGTLRITKTGKQKLVVKFTKKAKKAFKTRKKVTLTLVLTVKDAAGNATRKTAKLTLRR